MVFVPNNNILVVKFMFKRQHTIYCLENQNPDNPDNGGGSDNDNGEGPDGTDDATDDGLTDDLGNKIFPTTVSKGKY